MFQLIYTNILQIKKERGKNICVFIYRKLTGITSSFSFSNQVTVD